jgi:hypothetical protein
MEGGSDHGGSSGGVVPSTDFLDHEPTQQEKMEVGSRKRDSSSVNIHRLWHLAFGCPCNRVENVRSVTGSECGPKNSWHHPTNVSIASYKYADSKSPLPLPTTSFY